MVMKCKICGHDKQMHNFSSKKSERGCFDFNNPYNCKCEKFQPEDGMSVTVDLSYLEKQKKGCGKRFIETYGNDKVSWGCGEPSLCPSCQNQSPVVNASNMDKPVDTANRNEAGTQTLSDKIRFRMLQFTTDELPEKLEWLPVKDLKQSIKKLKEEFKPEGEYLGSSVKIMIDKIFGEKLV